MSDIRMACRICSSTNLTRFNSYKHYCYACGDCNGVFHERKSGRYLLEWVLPRAVFRKLLPRPAFLRIFHADDSFEPGDFYDVYAEECRSADPVRLSQARQVLDQFSASGIPLEDKRVLDISGGPGIVAQALATTCRRVVVTEYSHESVQAMADTLKLDAVKFDYQTDRLDDVVQEKFDVVLLRSSIIFCPDLDKFLASVSRVLAPGGFVLVETITPSLGEVFWWQQMEYKFPVIYSQETIEKLFYKHGFSLRAGYREYGSYVGVKWRGTHTLGRHLFTWLIDYPMMLAYYLAARRSKIPIDHRQHHKFLTQLWQKVDHAGEHGSSSYRTFHAGSRNQSPHFSYVYNGYLMRSTECDKNE